VVTLVAQGAVISAIMWRFGDVARRLADGNRRLAAAGDQLARRAVVEERVRIARELHDVVAHHLSVVAVQAGLARFVLRSDPDTAEAALGTVLDTDREALHELRRVLELLRPGEPADDDAAAAPGPVGPDAEADADRDRDRDHDDGSRFAPAPRLARLPDLARRVRAAGVPVDLVVTGAARPLASGLELCAFRMVQESLTNVIKHARPATATVTVEYASDELRVTVTDDGTDRKVAGDRVIGRGGNGLRGMRERAMLYGGTLRAGPRTGDGFEVQLVLPVRPSPPRPP
jgi:signal transduction histidine kinase